MGSNPTASAISRVAPATTPAAKEFLCGWCYIFTICLREEGESVQIESICVQKFRSIDFAELTFPHVLALVGANNAGKSHVLRALNAFFNYEQEKESFQNESHLYSKHSRPRITISFNQIRPEDEINSEYINNGRLTIRFTYRWDRKKPQYEFLGPVKRAMDADEFKRLMKHFAFIYVPIIRDYETAFQSKRGIAYKLLRQIFDQQTANRNNFLSAERQLVKKVEKTVYGQAISRIKRFYPFYTEHDFILKTQPVDIIDLILQNVSLNLLESSQENGIDNCGSGIQSAVFFAISIALCMINGTHYLVGIEEPELNMHPQAQRQLIEALKDEQRYPNTQFILTSHSTVMIDRLGHESVALCRKNKGEKRDIITSISQVSGNFLTKYGLDEERYYSFFDFKNSDFFFSNYIVITESPNDCKVIQHLLKLSGIDPEKYGVSLIPADGERNIKHPYAIAKELKIPFICVVDRDVFQPYLNNDKKASLDETGKPQYKNQLKENSPILDFMSKEDKMLLSNLFSQDKYSDVLILLEKYRIISMRYAFEIDLAICKSFSTALYSILKIADSDRSLLYLLTQKEKILKKYTILNEAIDRQGTKNLPMSYRQILRLMKKQLNQ